MPELNPPRGMRDFIYEAHVEANSLTASPTQKINKTTHVFLAGKESVPGGLHSGVAS